jgi:hypothetical protein
VVVRSSKLTEGSKPWGMPQLDGDLRLGDEILFNLPALPLERMSHDNKCFYPALSVPLGPEDEFNCPPTHVDFARERLRHGDGLNILSVGYSGLDSRVLKLLKESGNSLRSLYVVNQTPDHGRQAAEHIAQAFGSEVAPEMVSPVTFNESLRARSSLATLIASADLLGRMDARGVQILDQVKGEGCRGGCSVGVPLWGAFIRFPRLALASNFEPQSVLIYRHA